MHISVAVLNSIWTTSTHSGPTSAIYVICIGRRQDAPSVVHGIQKLRLADVHVYAGDGKSKSE